MTRQNEQAAQEVTVQWRLLGTVEGFDERRRIVDQMIAIRLDGEAAAPS